MVWFVSLPTLHTRSDAEECGLSLALGGSPLFTLSLNTFNDALKQIHYEDEGRP